MSDPKKPILSSRPIDRIDAVRFSQADEASSLLSSAYADVRVEPLGSAPFDMTTSSVSLLGIQIYQTESLGGVRFTSIGYFDGFTLSSMHAGSARVEARGARRDIPFGGNLALDAGRVDKMEIGQHSSFFGFAVGAADLQEVISSRVGEHARRRISFDEDRCPAAFQASCEGICKILLSGLHEDGHLKHNPLAVTNLRDALFNMILHGTRHSYSESLSKGALEAPVTVRRAIDYIYGHAHLPITTTDIARELGVGIRSLQLSFQRWQDTTPHHFLRQVRLKLARQDLLEGRTVNIGAIARKWGFNSTGEFARLYRDTFGELPSRTLPEIGRSNDLPKI